MEKEQVGKASEADAGDWILVRSRNPNTRRESAKIPKGWHFFDVVEGKLKGNNVKVAFKGSIAANTTIKKVGSDRDH